MFSMAEISSVVMAIRALPSARAAWFPTMANIWRGMPKRITER